MINVEELGVRFGAASLRSFIRISRTIRTADIAGTSENNRTLVRISVRISVMQGRGRLPKVRLLVIPCRRALVHLGLREQ